MRSSGNRRRRADVVQTRAKLFHEEPDAGFFENNGDPTLDGDASTSDAQLALQQAEAIGQPLNSAIYFVLEHLPNGYTSQDVPGVIN
jgi:hypothetical protein